MGAATQVFSHRFDRAFSELPSNVQRRIQDKIDAMGQRLASFSHHHMEGVDTYRLRIGDYRVIYEFDIETNELFLIAIGHRREVYRR